MGTPTRVLLIEDSASDAGLIARHLIAGDARFAVESHEQLQSGLRRLAEGGIDVVLLDLNLPDSLGLDTFRKVHAQAPQIPVVVLSGHADEGVATEALHEGAQDCLPKSNVDADSLTRSIRYAIERSQRRQAEGALRDSEALYHSLVENLPVCILRKDLEGRFIFANRAYCEFTGRAVEEIIGKTDFDFSPPEIAEKFRRDDHRVVETNKQFRDVEVNETDGRKQWVEVIKTPVHDAAGRIIGTQAIFWDVTERMQAVEALRRAKEAAEAASRAKSEFLANMSHEIRTPLNAVIGMTELVLDSELTATQREYLQMVRESGESLLMVINDILDFSKIEAGKLELECRPFDVREHIGDAMKSLAVRADSKGLELACHFAPAVPQVISGDPNRLRQIVINLVGNAIKFTDEGEIVLDVRVESQSDEEATLRFAVSDTGIGISREKLSTIFDAFDQADTSTTRRFGGTGLGLSISSRLVALMGGRIWAESRFGVGSKFHFTVRVGAPQAAITAPPSRRVTCVQDTRVLVVDDNATNRLILEEMLGNWGMKPVGVPSAHDALYLMREAKQSGQPYPLVLSDVHMPGIDGHMFVERMKRDRELADTLVIMLTSGNHPGDISRCSELGATACLLKPVKQSELFDAIVEALDVTSAQEEVGGEAPEDHVVAIRPLRVLLAEDSPINQKLAVGLLEKWGHSVTVAGNGNEAVARFESGQFDLILMDVQMPELDGLDATAHIRERERSRDSHVPIIAMTAHAMKGDRQKCLDAGMDGYVPKPIRIKTLHETIASLLSNLETGRQVAVSHGQVEPVHVDWADALRTCEGDRDLLKQVVELFLEETPVLLKQLNEALQKGDEAAVRRAAHTIKGNLRPFGLVSASSLANQIEEWGRSGDLTEVGEPLKALRQEISQIAPAFTAFLSSDEVSNS